MTTQRHFGKTMVTVLVATALTLTALPGVASADGDGDVDGRDFLLWQRGGSPAAGGGADLAHWQSNYGVGPAASQGALDPEFKYVPVRR